MTRRGGLVLAGGLLVGVLGPACAPTEKDPVVTVAAAEPLIHDGAGLPEGTNPTTPVTITVLDELGQKGTGVVRVTTKVGLFGAEGNNTLVTLSDGSATLDFTCPVAKDPTCAQGVASISADWRGNVGRGKVYVGEKGKQLMSGSKSPSAPPPISGGDPTETGTFDVFTTSRPYFLGSLQTSQSGFRAASPVTQPLRSFVGFPSSGLANIELRSDGKLVYKLNESSTANLYLAMGDAFTTDDTSTKTVYPALPTANDQLIPTTRCGPSGVGTFHTHPTLPEVYYSCAGVGASPYYNEAGVQVVPNTYFIQRVGYNGYKLVADVASAGTTLYLLDANNTPRMVSLPSNPNTRYMRATASRAKSNGFDMLYDSGDVLQLWNLSFAGAWSRVGVYPVKLPTGYTLALNHNWVLDGQGSAYVEVTSAQGDGIARYSLGAAEATILYKVSNRPADSGWDQWPPKLYNVLDRSILFTGP